MSESVVRTAGSNWIDPIHCLTSILYSALVFKSFSIRKKTKTADSLKFFDIYVLTQEIRKYISENVSLGFFTIPLLLDPVV